MGATGADGLSGVSIRRVLAGGAALGGALALFAGSPYRARHATLDIERVAAAIAREEDHVTALELAAWIKDRKPGLRVVDLRDAAAFDVYHLPRAERIALESLASTPFRATDTVVLVSDGGAHAAQAWVLLQALGLRRVTFLRGGLNEWIDTVLNPTIGADAAPGPLAAFRRVSELSRYFGGVPRVVDAPPTGSAAPRVPAGTPEPPTKAAAVRGRGC